MSASAAAFEAAREDAREAEARRAPQGGPTPSEERLLAVVGRLYKPGDLVSPSRVANEMGTDSNRISMMILALRKKGIWPYAKAEPGARPAKAPAPQPEADPEPEAPAEAEYPALRARVAGEDPKPPYPRKGTTRPKASRPPKPAEPEAEAPEPYPGHVPNHDPKADAELLVIQRIVAQLMRLPTWGARQRVLKYLDDRMLEAETDEP